MSAPVYYRTETETEKIYTVIPDYLYDTNTKTLVKSTTPPTPTPIPPTPTPTKDKWGINYLNPTKSGGREYFMNITAPEQDGIMDLRSASLVKQSDGSWLAGPNPVRLYIMSPSPLAPWKNTEMTGYFYVLTGTSGTIQTVGRGGIHTEQQYKMSDGSSKWGMAMGSKLGSRIYVDGSCRVVKEIGHSVYSGQSRGSKSGAVPSLVGPRHWFGLKTVFSEYKNSSGVECVRIKSYIDNNAQNSSGQLEVKNDWKPLTEAVDDGTWNCDSGTTEQTISTFAGLIAKCGTPPGMTKEQYAKMPITWAGHPTFLNDPLTRKIASCASWRWDGLGVKCTYLSAREIVPPTA